MLESINHKLCLRDNANVPLIFFLKKRKTMTDIGANYYYQIERVR